MSKKGNITAKVTPLKQNVDKPDCSVTPPYRAKVAAKNMQKSIDNFRKGTQSSIFKQKQPTKGMSRIERLEKRHKKQQSSNVSPNVRERKREGSTNLSRSISHNALKTTKAVNAFTINIDTNHNSRENSAERKNNLELVSPCATTMSQNKFMLASTQTSQLRR